MLGRGLAYVIVTARVNRELFPQFPEYLAEIDGIPLDDDRNENPIAAIRTIMLGLDYNGTWLYGPHGITDAHLPGIEAQMDKCDVSVSLASGGTVPRFRAGYEVRVDEEPHAVIGEFLKACQGRMAEVGGRYRILVAEPDASVASFTDEDIVISEGQTYEPFPGLEETYNGVTATYPEPAEAWETKEAPPRYDAALETADDGRRLPLDTDFKAVPYKNQVQRNMLAMLLDMRRFRRHTFTAPPSWWEYEPLDCVEWTSSRNGYDAKSFLITTLDDFPTSLQGVGLQEVDPSDYDWSTDYELPESTAIVEIDRPTAQVMTGWTVEPYTFVDESNGARRPGIRVLFDGELDDVRAVRIVVRLAASQAIVFDGEAPYDASVVTPSVVLAGTFLPATDYEARGIFLPFSGRETSWSSWLAVTTPDVRIGASDLATNIQEQIIDAGGVLSEQLDAAQATLDLLAAGTSLAISTESREREVVYRAVRQEAIDRRAQIAVIADAYVAADQALANLISLLEADFNASTALISDQLLALADADSSLASSITAVSASVGQATAQGLFKIETVVAPAGVEARAALFLRATTGSAWKEAGLFIDIVGGVARVFISADKFAIGNATTGAVPFAIEGDKIVLTGNVLIKSQNGVVQLDITNDRILFVEP